MTRKALAVALAAQARRGHAAGSKPQWAVPVSGPLPHRAKLSLQR